MAQTHLLQGTRFRKIRLPDPTNPSPEASTPLITVPDFSTRFPWEVSSTAALHFLLHLPLVRISELPPDTSPCSICYTSYGSGEQADKPVRLVCQHTFGRRCLGKWVLRADMPPMDTCPKCRRVLFREDEFVTPLASSPREDGAVEDWIRETERVCQGDPYAEERVEMLMQDLARVGPEDRRTELQQFITSAVNDGELVEDGRRTSEELTAARVETLRDIFAGYRR